MADATMTNGTLVDAVRTRVADDLARTGVRPGRRRLARDLGVTEHAVRQALDTLAAEQNAWHQPADGVLRPSTIPSATHAGEDAPAQLTPNPPGRPMGDPDRSQSHLPVAVDHTPGESITETAAARPTDAAGSPARARPGGRVHPVRRWPLLLIALPAFVAIWGGWVGLGRVAGFGPVEPLPGISTFTIDLAITLPIGVEVYSAYALSVWLGGQVHGQAARRFASCSALSSLLVGAAGQVAYHLMNAAGTTVAPWGVTALVATLPVVTLGMAATLHHLIAEDLRVAADVR